MGLNINCIIVLENKEEYITLNQVMYYGKKYFLAMGLDSNRKVNNKKVVIFEEYVNGFDTYVIKVVDSATIGVLTGMFKAQREK